MKIFLIEIETLTDETHAQTITEKETLDKAISDFHATMAYAMNNEDVNHVCCMIINDEGGIYKTEIWTRPVVE